MLELYGRHVGSRNARKHLAWYLADLPNGRALASEVNRLDEPEAVCERLREIFAEPIPLAAQPRARNGGKMIFPTSIGFCRQSI